MQQFSGSETEGAYQARQAAQSWLAEFAPLLVTVTVYDEAECRRRLEVVTRLRANGAQVLANLTATSIQDVTLLSTFQQAWNVIDRVDEDIRGQLARLAPGAPEGRVDMDSLRQQIADLSARKEIGVKSSITQDRLELTTGAQGNRTDRERGAIVAVSIVFAMIMLMIAKEGHGPSPVLAIIMTAFLVRFFLRVATLRRSNRIVLEGRKLRVFGMLGSRDYQLGPQSRAYAGTSLVPSQNGNPYYRAAILMLDANGSEISIPVMQAPAFQEELVRKINAYLAAQAP